MSKAGDFTRRERDIVVAVANDERPALEKEEWSRSPILAACMAVIAIDDAWDEDAKLELIRVLDGFRSWPDSRIAAAVGTRLGMLSLWWTDDPDVFDAVRPIAEVAVMEEPDWVLNNLLLFDCLAKVGANSAAFEVARKLARSRSLENPSTRFDEAFDTLFIGARSWTHARAQDLLDRARSAMNLGR
jgi:hypothetical protein